MPRLGFKLWARNCRRIVVAKTRIFFNNNKGLFEFVIAGAGVVLAWKSIQLAQTANTISNATLNLSKNDTSQQAQINRLGAVIGELRSQNASQNRLLESVTKEISILAAIQGGTSQQNMLMKELSDLTSKQLLTANKSLEWANLTDSLNTIVGRYKLYNAIREATDSISVSKEVVLRNAQDALDSHRISRTIHMYRKIKDLIDNEIANYYFIKDESYREKWWRASENLSHALFYVDLEDERSFMGMLHDLEGSIWDLFIVLSDYYSIRAKSLKK